MNTESKLTAERVAEIRARQLDLSDIPELTREQWQTGHFRNQRVTFVLDSDNSEWIQPANSGYENRLNNALRWAREHNCPLVG